MNWKLIIKRDEKGTTGYWEAVEGDTRYTTVQLTLGELNRELYPVEDECLFVLRLVGLLYSVGGAGYTPNVKVMAPLPAGADDETEGEA